MMRDMLIEAMARAIYEKRNGFGCKAWSRLPQLHHAPYKQDATAALAAIEAAGCVVVPREPTREMVQAGPFRGRQNTEESMYHGIYRAMLAASPLAQKPGR